MGVCEEGIVAEIVCADPDGVDGVVGSAGKEFGLVWAGVFGVGEESGDFVFPDRGERVVDGGEEARGYCVGTYSAANGVVVEACISIQRGIAGP